MIKKAILGLTIFWISTYGARSQNYGDINTQVDYPSSPDVSSLGEFGEFPVNLQNGLVNISIPLETVKGRHISFPISLNYDASGVKVDEVASWLGLQWSLNGAGGVITRQVVGEADDYGDGFFKTYANVVDASGIDYLDDDQWYNLKQVYRGYKDYEPDVFYVNMPGYSGSFRLGNDGRFYSEDMENIKIHYEGLADPINGRELFEITIPNGTVYRFGIDKYENEVLEKTDTEVIGRYLYGPSKLVISGWYLTEIISPDKQDHVYFNYADANFGDDNLSQSHTYSNLDFPTVYDYYETKSIYRFYSKKLTSIEFSRGKLEFNTMDDRLDWSGVRLASINVFEKINGSYSKIRTIEFLNEGKYHDRPLGKLVSANAYATVPESNKYSLKLDGINVVGKDGSIEQNYQFRYNSQQLPARKTTAQDYWGYYNGKLSNANLIPEFSYRDRLYGSADRMSSSSAKAGVLKEIVYPTGGVTKFDFDTHYLVEEIPPGTHTELVLKYMNVTAVGKVPDGSTVAETKLVDENIKTIDPASQEPAWITYEFSQVNGNQGSSPIKVELIRTSDNSVIFSQVYHGTSETVSGTYHFDPDDGLKTGEFMLRATTCDCTSDESIIGASLTSATLHYYEYEEITSPGETIYTPIGGLRVKSIKNYDSESASVPSQVKTYEYEGGVLINSNFDSYVYRRFRPYTDADPNGLPGCDDVADGLKEKSMTISSSSYTDFGQKGGSHFEYGKVTEYVGTEDDNIGKTEYYYEYTEPKIARFGNVWLQFDFLLYPNYLKGLLDKKIIYKYDGVAGTYVPVQKVDYGYNTLIEKEIKAFKLVNRLDDPDYFDHNYLCHRKEVFEPFNYNIIIGRRSVTSVATTIFTDNGNNLVKAEYTDYEPEYYQPYQKRISSSDGSPIVINYKYAYDRLSIPNLTSDQIAALAKMEEEGRTGEVVEETTNKGSVTIKSIRTNYKLDDNNIVMPDEVMQSFEGGSYEKVLTFEKYESGKPVQYYDIKAGLRYAVIFGFDHSLPIVKAIDIDHESLKTVVGTALSNAGYLNGFDDLDKFLEDLGDLTTPAQRINLATFNENLRSQLPQKQIESFTYLPLYGLTSKTDANGQVSYFDFDNLGRLKSLSDNDRNIMQYIEYNYRK